MRFTVRASSAEKAGLKVSGQSDIFNKEVPDPQDFLQKLGFQPSNYVSDFYTLGPRVIDGVGHLYLDDPIDDYFGVSRQTLNKGIDEIIDDVSDGWVLHINSPGGSVYSARSMRSSLAELDNLTVLVDGQCSSAATYLLTSGVRSQAAKGSIVMVHMSMTYGFGNAKDFESLVDILKAVDEDIIADYVESTGQTDETIRNLLTNDNFQGTTLSAEKAQELGFIDEVVNPGKGKTRRKKKKMESEDEDPEDSSSTKVTNQSEDVVSIQQKRAQAQIALMDTANVS